MKHHPRFKLVIIAALLPLLLGVWLTFGPSPHLRAETPASRSPAKAVQHAWQQAQKVGVYDFSSDIVQTTHPAPAIANVGRSSHQDELYLQGALDRPARTMQLTQWQNGGSAASGRDGAGDRSRRRDLRRGHRHHARPVRLAGLLRGRFDHIGG